jgi:hypothetical protein
MITGDFEVMAADDRCLTITPDHRVQVAITLSTDRRLNDYRPSPDQPADPARPQPQPVTIAGRPGLAATTTDSPQHDRFVIVATTTDPAAPGVLALDATTSPPRGDATAPPDDSTLPAADRLADALLHLALD